MIKAHAIDPSADLEDQFVYYIAKHVPQQHQDQVKRIIQQSIKMNSKNVLVRVNKDTIINIPLTSSGTVKPKDTSIEITSIGASCRP